MVIISMNKLGGQVQVRRLRAGPGHQPLHVRRRRRRAVRQLVGRHGARPPAVAPAGARPRRPPRARPAAGRTPSRTTSSRRSPTTESLTSHTTTTTTASRSSTARSGSRRRPSPASKRSCRWRAAARARLSRRWPGSCGARARGRALGMAAPSRRSKLLFAVDGRPRFSPPLPARGVLRQRHRAHQRGVRGGGAGVVAAARRAAGARRRGGRDGRVHAVRRGLLRADPGAAVAGVDAAHHGVVAAGLPRRRLRVGPARGVRSSGATRSRRRWRCSYRVGRSRAPSACCWGFRPRPWRSSTGRLVEGLMAS
jgi:hypothetical protein